MSFNVNFLGQIPYNPDSLHVPSGLKPEEKKDFIGNEKRILGYSLNQMYRDYWTVRSFEINVTAQVTDTVDPLSQFIAGGGTSAGAIGALAGTASIGEPQNGNTSARGYTKIYSKYEKVKRNTAEGIINNLTPFQRGGKTALDVDTSSDPYLFESHIYKPNEGTLCSAGPVHFFSGQNVRVELDFSNIKYFTNGRIRGPRLYWPEISIYISVPSAKAEFSNLFPPLVTISPNRVGLINQPLSIINLNVNGVTSNLGNTRINSRLFNTQIANVNINIQPGKRCCDRFFWDGKDEERINSSEPPLNDSNPCQEVCGDEEKGVYRKRSEKNY